MKMLRYILPMLFLITSACSGRAEREDDQVVGDPGIASMDSVPMETPLNIAPTATVVGNLTEAESTHKSVNDSTITAFSSPVTAQGEVLVVSGRVLDQGGNPLEAAAVEFWQTDVNGVYDHPGDPGTGSHDQGFQFFGTAITTANGGYAFRTIFPGRYEPRPPHIHVKIRYQGEVVLITQIYFVESGTGGGLGAGADQLVLVTKPETDPSGATYHAGVFDFIVKIGNPAGELPLTPSQGEGPYYPVVDVSQFDNDLANVNP